jgi:ribonuclease BN (tRNA processing enzyme)
MASISIASGLQIKNSWTGAGISSFVHVVSADKSTNILFDCGSVEPSVLSASFVFCTHGHMDHIGGCVAHARARCLHTKSATYYVPECCKEGLLEQKSACEKMDGREIPMNVRICRPGEYVRVSKSFRIRVFQTEHRVPSQGYAVYYQPPACLKAEFVGVPADEMRELARSGVQLKEPAEEVLQMVYTGDSTFRGLCSPENMFIFSAPVLIMECTYLKPAPVAGDDVLGDTASSFELEGDRAKAVEYGHVHLDDVLNNAHMFDEVEHLVFVHLSMKYQPYYRALEIFRAYLPPELLCKAFCCVKALGSANFLTKIANGARSAASSRSASPSTPSARARGGHGEARKRRDDAAPSEQDLEWKQVGYGWGSYKRTVRRAAQEADTSGPAVGSLTLSSSTSPPPPAAEAVGGSQP